MSKQRGEGVKGRGRKEWHRAFRALWIMAKSWFFPPMTWEPQRVLGRGGTCPDSGALLAAVCGRGVRVGTGRPWQEIEMTPV